MVQNYPTSIRIEANIRKKLEDLIVDGFYDNITQAIHCILEDYFRLPIITITRKQEQPELTEFLEWVNNKL